MSFRPTQLRVCTHNHARAKRVDMPHKRLFHGCAQNMIPQTALRGEGLAAEIFGDESAGAIDLGGASDDGSTVGEDGDGDWVAVVAEFVCEVDS